ncbi:porin family protein [Oceanicoccus sp. KOV_DT_Chl]|uniref:porin family protein n=1 Tax=Oceanicoccus sp. KOV_DT_Chl TaxID=1904639 RepID=UPI000C7C60AF|nr:porin family protein [Oceanicoccus sp. KOV_DT_Chl]
MKKTLLALAVSSLIAPATFAEEAGNTGWYIGGSYAQLDTDFDDLVEFDLAALVFNAGYKINDYIAIETRLGTGITDDDIVGVDLELDYLWGVYAKAGIPTGTAIYPYVVLGYTKAELELSGYGYSESDSDSDTSYGIGADFSVNDNVGIFAEYMNWYDDDGVEISGFNIGASYKF